MSNLLVGHVTGATARVWTRGDKKTKKVELSYRTKGVGAWKTEKAELDANRGYVFVFDLEALAPSTEYELDVAFKPAGSLTPTVGAGSFRTAPAAPREVTFLLGSCYWREAPFDILDPEEAWKGILSLIGSLSPDFMIHCGDQIYADLPGEPAPFMNVVHYRNKYQKAWKVKPTAQALANLPHYMILDDHEIFDDYYNGKLYTWEDSAAIFGSAMTAYKEYQHSHNPQPYDGYYYSFGYGGVEFFVMDVRTERYPGRQEIMDSRQMDEFKNWLRANAAATKFVVTSVPFVAETKQNGDKWNALWSKPQRDEVIDFLAADPSIERLVFLTGDMHCSYHATMKIDRSDGTALVVHELMSSPINQFCNKFHAFLDHVNGNTKANVTYEVNLDEAEFYGKHSNVMLIKASTGGLVTWEVYRTKGVVAPPEGAMQPQPGPFQL